MASNKAQIYSVQEWDSWKGTIARLYLDEDMKLKDLIIELKQLFDIAVTEQQLKKRIKKWKLDSKNVKGDIMLELARIKEKRRLRNKRTSFRFNKKLVDDRKIERYVQRNNISEGELVSMASPEQAASPAFSVFTPRSMRSPTPDNRTSMGSPLNSNAFPVRKEPVIRVVGSPVQELTGPPGEFKESINIGILQRMNLALKNLINCICKLHDALELCVERYKALLAINPLNWSVGFADLLSELWEFPVLIYEDQVSVFTALQTLTSTADSLLPGLKERLPILSELAKAIGTLLGQCLDYNTDLLSIYADPESVLIFNRHSILWQDQMLSHRLGMAKVSRALSKASSCFFTTHARERTPFRDIADPSVLLSSAVQSSGFDHMI